MSARKRLDMGEMIKVERLARDGKGCSFKKSFIASARGWGRPVSDTLLGPFRDWI